MMSRPGNTDKVCSELSFFSFCFLSKPFVVGAAAPAAAHTAESDYPTPEEEDKEKTILEWDISNTVVVIVAPIIVTATHKPSLLTILTSAGRVPPVFATSVRTELALIPATYNYRHKRYLHI